MAHDDGLLAELRFAAVTEARDREHRAATAALLRDFVEVVDSLRSLEGRAAVPPAAVAAVVRQALAALARAGVEPIAAVGRPLDLARAEVVEVRPAAAAPDTVVEEESVGYMWNGSVFRPARVVVAGPASPRPE